MKLKKKEQKIFIFSFAVGLLAHLFIVANPVFNADGIFYNDSLGAGSILGRWFIELLNDISKIFGYTTVIPMLNIVLSISIISLASIFLLRLLDIKNEIYNYIIALSLIVSPSIIQTFFYAFTSHVYAISILFTILSIYFLIKKNNFAISVFFNCFALALYQAYIPFMLCIYIFIFIKMFLNEEKTVVFKKIITSIIAFLISFSLYYMLNDIINRKNNGYIFTIHGMSEFLFPKFTLIDIFNNIILCYKKFFDIIFVHNVFAHNTTLFIRIIYAICIFTGILFIILFIKNYLCNNSLYKIEKNKRFIKTYFIIFLLVLFPIALNFIIIMTNNNIKYTDDRLSLSYVFYIIFPLYFADLFKQYNKSYIKNELYKNVLALFCSIILMHNIWLAYGSYYNQYKIINASKSFALEIATAIKLLPDYDVNTKVLFIGSPYAKSSHYNYNFYVDVEHGLYSNLDYQYENILSEYPMKQIFKEFTALDFEEPDEDLANNLYYSKAVREMPLYPENGSIKNIDGVAVVKFKEIKY